jgi:hypothetical protein
MGRLSRGQSQSLGKAMLFGLIVAFGLHPEIAATVILLSEID